MPAFKSAPAFSRRVHDMAELQLALADAARAIDGQPADIAFDAVVRLELHGSGIDVSAAILSILKRN